MKGPELGIERLNNAARAPYLRRLFDLDHPRAAIRGNTVAFVARPDRGAMHRGNRP